MFKFAVFTIKKKVGTVFTAAEGALSRNTATSFLLLLLLLVVVVVIRLLAFDMSATLRVCLCVCGAAGPVCASRHFRHHIDKL